MNRWPAVTGEERGNCADVVEVAVTDDDSLRLRGIDRNLQGLPGQHPEIEKQAVVDEDGTPTNLAGAAEEANLHSFNGRGPRCLDSSLLDWRSTRPFIPFCRRHRFKINECQVLAYG
jgi:hypothetical protein